MLITSGAHLDGRQCSVLAGPLGDGVRRARARNERLRAEFLELVRELESAGLV